MFLAGSRQRWQFRRSPAPRASAPVATGGRGGEVFHVDNLANTNVGTYEGPNGYNHGTLRWCILNEASSLPRTVVFDVSGQVSLTSQITMEGSNITIAGQTAPGQGLSSAGKPWLIESGGNLVIRYIRNRLGKTGGQDSIGVEGGSNIIFDHVTSTWSNDELLSVAKDGNLVTVQNSFIYEALNNNQGHAYGSLIRPDVDSKVTYHHNLYADNESRNPRPGTYNSKTLDFDFRNNVVYNWGLSAGYSGGSSEGNPEHVNMNYVGNYAIAGPSTYDHVNLAFHTEINAALQAYQSGNLIDSDLDTNRDGVDTGWDMFAVEAGSLTQMASPFAFSGVPVTTQSAAEAYDSVLDYAGSFWWNRDSADARVVNQVRNQTGTIIFNQSEVGGNPTLPTLTRDIATWDTDYDGMPNAWEDAHGLNPNLSSDRNNDFDTDGYTNLEEYINEVGAWPAPRAITWTGGTGRYALNQNWDTWQPSHFDEVRMNNGTATVDAIGQHARLVRIAANDGDTASLNIASGRLQIEEQLVIGTNLSKGILELSGGVLDTPLLSKGTGGSFNFTGGTLHADTVDVRPGKQRRHARTRPQSRPDTGDGRSHAQQRHAGDRNWRHRVRRVRPCRSRRRDDPRRHAAGSCRSTWAAACMSRSSAIMIPFLASSGGTGGMFDAFDLPALADRSGLGAFARQRDDVFGGRGSSHPRRRLQQRRHGRRGRLHGLAGQLGERHSATATRPPVWAVVDGADYDAWKANFGATAGPGAGSNRRGAGAVRPRFVPDRAAVVYSPIDAGFDLSWSLSRMIWPASVSIRRCRSPYWIVSGFPSSERTVHVGEPAVAPVKVQLEAAASAEAGHGTVGPGRGQSAGSSSTSCVPSAVRRCDCSSISQMPLVAPKLPSIWNGGWASNRLA